MSPFARIRRSQHPITDLASLYGIQITMVSELEFYNAKDIQRGPRGAGCCERSKVLYIAVEDRGDPSEQLDDANAVFLHELVHIIVEPPGENRGDFLALDLPEEWMLFQFERALARAAFVEEDLREVIDWQEQTGLSVQTSVYTHSRGMLKDNARDRMNERRHSSIELGDIRNYERTSIWHCGLRLCRHFGLLDARNRPTGEWPDWSRVRGTEWWPAQARP